MEGLDLSICQKHIFVSRSGKRGKEVFIFGQVHDSMEQQDVLCLDQMGKSAWIINSFL